MFAHVRAQEADDEEDRRYGSDKRGDELPEELSFREGRLEKLREAVAALEAEAQAEAKGGNDPGGAGGAGGARGQGPPAGVSALH